jgi:hypothetical protein
MALRREIVDLVGLRLLDQADQVGRVGQVAVVQEEPGLVLVRIDVEMVHPTGIERGGTPLHSVHHVTLGQQERRQISAVLPCDPGDQRDLAGHESPDCDSTQTTPFVRCSRALHDHRGHAQAES